MLHHICRRAISQITGVVRRELVQPASLLDLRLSLPAKTACDISIRNQATKNLRTSEPRDSSASKFASTAPLTSPAQPDQQELCDAGLLQHMAAAQQTRAVALQQRRPKTLGELCRERTRCYGGLPTKMRMPLALKSHAFHADGRLPCSLSISTDVSRYVHGCEAVNARLRLSLHAASEFQPSCLVLHAVTTRSAAPQGFQASCLLFRRSTMTCIPPRRSLKFLMAVQARYFETYTT